MIEIVNTPDRVLDEHIHAQWVARRLDGPSVPQNPLARLIAPTVEEAHILPPHLIRQRQRAARIIAARRQDKGLTGVQALLNRLRGMPVNS